MSTSVLEQYRVSDLLHWYDTKQLVLNPSFQRRSVWSKTAKVFLIDTILRQMPVPKIYMRTKVDLNTKRSYREIVDGQQRLRAITEFAHDKFELTSRAGEFAGLTYSDLPPEMQERFLAYPLSVDQLINASDSDVLEVFSRLNVYNVRLNGPELRHAEYQGQLKWAVHRTSMKASEIWEDLGVLTVNQRLRMADDSLTAEMFSILMVGVTDGGQAIIDRFYRDNDPESTEARMDSISSHVLRTLNVIKEKLGEVVSESQLARSPHFLMLFAAVAHSIYGIPKGELDELPNRDESLTDVAITNMNLDVVAGAIAGDFTNRRWAPFILASSGSTQRIASRKVRFPIFFSALLPEPLS